MSLVQKLGFSDLVMVLEKCTKATNTAQRDNYMQKFLTKVVDHQSKFKERYPTGNSSLFPLLRMILATYEHERAYGMQEKRLRQLLVKSFGITGNEAKRIEQCNDDDIADAVYEILSTRTKSTLTVADVDEMLEQISEGNDRKHQLDKLFLKGSALDLKWIVKILLKNMKLKISPGKILEKVHPLGGKLFSKYNHLSTVIEFIETGQAEEAMKDVVKPFTPIRAMLSQKFTSRDMNDILARFELYQETKMDGERFQLHMDNGVCKYFSRNAHDYSVCFNELITPLVKFKSVVHSLILDGEMLIWNKNLKRFVTKGETDMDVKKIKGVDYHLRPCFCAFDVLFLNGTSYINEPFCRRFEILHSLFDDLEGVLIHTQPVKIRDVEHLVSQFNEALKHEEEGIILKKADSPYMPGEREKGGWYKMKADYFDGDVVKEFDCVIIGGNFQNFHTRDIIQRYELGAIEKQDDGTYNVYSIGDVVTGITNSERMKLHEKLIQHAFDYRGGEVVDFEMGKIYFGKTRPEVIIPPHKSIVLQVRVSELAPTSDYYTAYTFRFQRIVSPRFDKFWDESCTLKEFKEMYENEGGRVVKVNKRNVHRDDILSPEKKQRRAPTSTRARAIENFCHDSQEEIEPIDNVLAGMEFCVKTSSAHLPSPHDLKLLLKLHGATLVEFPRKKNTYAVVAGDIEQQIKIYINQKSHSIVKADWVANSFTKETPLSEMPKITPLDFHFLTTEMYGESFQQEYDIYGDSYFEPLKSEEELMAIVENMKVDYEISTGEMKELESEIFNCDVQENFKFFRGLCGQFIYEDELNMLMKWSEKVFEFRGGEISKKQETTDTLVFVDRTKFKRHKHTGLNKSKIIDYKFILDSSEANMIEPLNEYTVGI